MTADYSQPDFEDELLARFLRELESATDRLTVIDDFCSRHPGMADEFRAMAELNQLVDRAGRDGAIDQPVQLGDFRIVRRIGRGGMGDIYEAVQDRLNRRVAVKTIRRGAISPLIRGRFLREQRVLAKLHQTNIVPIHAAGDDGDLQYFAMQYIDGASLNKLIQAAAEYDTKSPGSKTPSLTHLADLVTDGTDGKEEPEKIASERAPRTLSTDYFRSVARAMADAAEAVEHAHRLHVLHRDVKPSNILIERTGRCWMIDFGLAGYLGQVGDRPANETIGDDAEALTTGAIVGTPQYMAPEQWRGEPADARTDVWGLGATLYELSTLHRAFDAANDADVRKQVLEAEPKPPRDHVTNLPVDLSAICLKALRKDAVDRYATAQEFADDLRRWLRWEPTQARPARTVRRVGLWARRNKGWAAAMMLTLAALSGLGIIANVTAKLRADDAERRERDALALKEESEKNAKQQQREVLLSELQRLRSGVYEAGWSNTAWQKAVAAAAIRTDARIRDEAAATLSGIDAKLVKTFDFPASSVVFYSTGKQLLTGGTDNSARNPAQAAKLSDGFLAQASQSGLIGAGPVGFASDGTPLQLAMKDESIIVLWNVSKRRPIGEFRLPSETDRRDLALALAPGGAYVAAVASSGKNNGHFSVWDVATGKLIKSSSESGTAVAFSQDQKLVAIGNAKGGIFVWSLPTGDPVAMLKGEVNSVTALAFGQDPRRTSSIDGRVGGSLLAVGNAAGLVMIWDIEARMIRSYCRGSDNHIQSIAFSPDKMTLATVSRGHAKLWDLASGSLLLNVPAGNVLTGVTFSPDGTRLAACSETAFLSPGCTSVWELKKNRGFTTLYGLNVRIEKVTFSPDDRLVAAIGQDNRVAVWILAGNRLVHVFEGPPALSIDNAAIAFSPDSQLLAVSGSTAINGQAKVWEVATGREVLSRSYPPGLNNVLAFTSDGKLLLFQVEERAALRLLDHTMTAENHPRVGRVRDLSSNTPKITCQIVEFNSSIQHPCMPTDGRLVVFVGYATKNNVNTACIATFDTSTGKALWRSEATSWTWHPSGSRNEIAGIMLDRSGRYLLTRSDSGVINGEDSGSVIELPSGRYYGALAPIFWPATGWSPTMPYWVYRDMDRKTPMELKPRNSRDAAFCVDPDQQSCGVQSQFSHKGNLFAWGNVDGTVSVCDIDAVLKRLTAAGFRK